MYNVTRAMQLFRGESIDIIVWKIQDGYGGETHALAGMSFYQYAGISLRLSVQKSYNVKNQSLEFRPIAEERRVFAFCVKGVKSSLKC